MQMWVCVANLYPYGQALPEGVFLSIRWDVCYASGGTGSGDGNGAVGHMLAGWAMDLSIRCLNGCRQGLHAIDALCGVAEARLDRC